MRLGIVRKKRGFTTPTVTIFLGGAVMIGLSVVSLSGLSDKTAGKSVDKSQATTLAETGAQLLYASIRESMRDSGNMPDALPVTQLKVTESGNPIPVGQYSATLISTDIATKVVSWGDGSQADQIDYRITVEGQGRSKFTTSRVRTTYLAKMFKSKGRYRNVQNHSAAGAGNGIPLTVCPGAIMANNKVELLTNGGVRTFSSLNDAHIVANLGIIWQPSSGSKSAQVNPNVIDIQGQFQVPGTAEYAYIYDFTVGPFGLGNPNGTRNYRSPGFRADGINPALPQNTVARRSNPRPYPSQTMFGQWRTEWISKATTGANYPDVSSSTMTPRVADGWKVITAPAILDSLEIKSGDVVRLLPSSSDPKENIIYIKGNVRNLATLKNLGVTLVIEGEYTDSSSSIYELDETGSIYSSMNSLMQNANFISVNGGASAVNFSTNSSSTIGLIYATSGRINVSGVNPEFRGKLVAAGPLDAAGVRINTRGNSFVVHYDPYAGGNRHIIPSAEIVTTTTIETVTAPGTIIGQFDPGRMENWLQIK